MEISVDIKLTGLLILLLTNGLLLSGCTTDSEDLNTSGIEANMSVIVGESKVTTRVDLSVSGGSGPVELSGGDNLFAKPDITARKQLLPTGSDGRYEADFGLNEFVSSFTFSLERENDDEDDAPNSIVTVPASFAITFPANNAEFYKTDAIQVTWSNPANTQNIDIELMSTCAGAAVAIQPLFKTSQNDDGEYTISNEQIQDFYPDSIDTACDLSIDVIRRRNGSADSNLNNDSEITAERRDGVVVRLLAN